MSDHLSQEDSLAALPTAEKRSLLRRLLKLANHFGFKLLIAFGIFYFLYTSDALDLSELQKITKAWEWTLYGSLAILPTHLLVTYRYYLILHGLGLPCTYFQALLWVLTGEFWSVALPGGTGGDLPKAMYVAAAYGQGKRLLGVISVIMDRAIGLVGLFFFALLVCLFNWETIAADPRLSILKITLLAVCGSMTFFFVLISWPRFRNSKRMHSLLGCLPAGGNFQRLFDGLTKLGESPTRLAGTLLLSIMNHAVWCSAILLFSFSLDLDIELVKGLVVIPLGLLLNMFGVAGGFGVGEVAFGILFDRMLGLQYSDGVHLALVFHIVALLMRLCCFPFYLLVGKAKSTTKSTS